MLVIANATPSFNVSHVVTGDWGLVGEVGGIGVFVLVVTLAVGDAVDDDFGGLAGDAGEGFDGLIDFLGAGDLCADDAEDFVATAGDEACVGDDERGRCVDDDAVELVLEQGEAFVEVLALEEFDGISFEAAAGAHEAEVGEEFDGADEFGRVALEEVGKSGAESDIEHGGEVALAEVGVDQEHFESTLGE